MLYNIIINDKIEETTKYPNWVRWAERPGSFEATSEDKAEAILLATTEIRDEIYANIQGKPICQEEFPMAVIQKSRTLKYNKLLQEDS